MSQYTRFFPLAAGGGGGGSGTVTSVGVADATGILTVTGSPITTSGTITLGLANEAINAVFAGPTSGAPGAPSFRNLVPSDIPGGTGSSNTFAGYDNYGSLTSIPGFGVDTTSGGMNESLTEQPNNLGFITVNSINIAFDPLQNSPNQGYNIEFAQANLDVNSSGFSQGTAGQAITVRSNQIYHHGKGNTGGLSIASNNFDLGNGTDPITVNGIAYEFGFGDIRSGVTVNGPIQGYGFQPNAQAGSVLLDNTNAFYDFSTFQTATPGYTGFDTSPSILSVSNNNNYQGFISGPTITTLSGNAGYTGLGIFPNIGTLNSGSFKGVTITPSITLNNSDVVGIDVSMASVTNYAGAQAHLVVQDITYTVINPGASGNSLTMQYTNTAVAGSETASLSGNDITVQIQSGVSTATQVRTAILANTTISSNVSSAITGVASNPQVTYAQTSFAGGIDPGTKKAANFDGDVSINGALSFAGALSIGQLNSLASFSVASGAGVASVDTLITAPSVAASATITGTDLLAINTAMLLNIGAGASVTTNFLGFAALGLPAVLSMGAGSTIDRVEGAIFAISLDSGAGGGTAAEVNLCRALAIPNGITTVNRLIAYEFDLPFGDPGTSTWGLYSKPATAHNFMAGDLKIGGADTVVNASVALEIESTTKAVLMCRMTTTQKNALTAVAGMMVYDVTLNQMSYYNGTTWVNL